MAVGRRAEPGGGWESQATPDSEILPRWPCRQARSWATDVWVHVGHKPLDLSLPAFNDHIWTGCGDPVA